MFCALHGPHVLDVKLVGLWSYRQGRLQQAAQRINVAQAMRAEK